MSISKLLIRCTAVALLAASLAAMSAASAFGWSIEGTELAGSAALATTAQLDKAAVLEGGGLNIECSGNLESVKPEIKSPNAIVASGLTFTGCKTANTNCSVPTTIGTVPAFAETIEETSPKVKATFKPTTGSVFATIKFSGEKCAVAGVKPVTGDVETLLATGQEERTLQLDEVNQTATGLLKIASSAASLTGSGLLKLASGKKFNALTVIRLRALSGVPSVNAATGKFELKFVAAGETIEIEVINMGAAGFQLEKKEITPNENNFKFVAPAMKACVIPGELKPGVANACRVAIKVQNVGGEATFKLEYDGKKKYEVMLKE